MGNEPVAADRLETRDLVWRGLTAVALIAIAFTMLVVF
jgi:hypothetical protein